MFNEVLDAIKTDLNAYLRLKIDPSSSTNYVSLVPIAGSDSPPVSSEIAMTLVKIEENRLGGVSGQKNTISESEVSFCKPQIGIDLHVLFSAGHADGSESSYKEALKRISYVVMFFQNKRVFDSKNTANLAPEQGRFVMDLYNQDFVSQYNLWSMFGGAYRPSVLYTLKTVVFVGDVTGTGSVIREIDIDSRNLR